MRSNWALLGVVTLVQIALMTEVRAIECSPPPNTTLRESRADFDFATLQVLKLRGPSVAGAVQTQSKSLLEKLPNADKALVELTYLHTLCTALRDDRSLPEREKARLFVEYRRALNPPVPSSPSQAREAKPASSRTPAPAPAPAVSASRPTTSISNNTGPVVVGNDVKGDLNINAGGK